MRELKIDESDLKKIFIADTRGARFWRGFKRLFKQLLALTALYFLFFILLNFSAYWIRFQYSVSAQPAPTVTIPEPEPAAPKIEYAPEIEIPKLSVLAPLQLNIDPNIIVESLNSGVAHYLNSALPGQIGNSVIVGHSSDFPWSTGAYKNVFALLDKLVAGDHIIVRYGTEQYIYETVTATVVSPTEMSVLARTDQPVLTLLTCYPVGTTQSRLIVTAKLISNNVGATQTTDPLTGEALPRPR